MKTRDMAPIGLLMVAVMIVFVMVLAYPVIIILPAIYSINVFWGQKSSRRDKLPFLIALGIAPLVWLILADQHVLPEVRLVPYMRCAIWIAATFILQIIARRLVFGTNETREGWMDTISLAMLNAGSACAISAVPYGILLLLAYGAK